VSHKTVAYGDVLAPLRAEPARSAVLLDVDGVLAPITAWHAQADVPDATRNLLEQVAARYGVVACVSGRRALDARRVVGLDSLIYVGAHGSELLRPGQAEPLLDPEVLAWAPRVRAFTERIYRDQRLERLAIRLEDKEAITAFHWRGATDEAAAQRAVQEVAHQAEAAGLNTHWGRKVLEVRPPVRIDKGAGILNLLGDTTLAAAMYVGDDVTDLDAFRGLTKLAEQGRLGYALRVGVGSDEGPWQLREEADLMVSGVDEVRSLLQGLVD